MPVVMWFSKLNPGVEPSAYEDWVRTTDYVLAREIECILSYEVHRVEGPFENSIPVDCDYIEIVKITDIDVYRTTLKNHPALDKILAEIDNYVIGVGDALCRVIEP